MKIINSHYIPLPEPHWLIVDTMGNIHEQIGTLTVVEGERKDGYGIVTHSYPVVANAIADVYDDSKEDGKSEGAALAPADGYTLDDTEVCECFRLCPTNHRVVPYLKFNLMAMKYFTSNNPDDFDLGDTIIVTRGVWENTVAEIKRIDEHKEMVTINVDMFGRETPVEISFADVKKMD